MISCDSNCQFFYFTESGNKLSAVVIGSVVGVAIILVLGCLILCVLLLTFGIRQKYKSKVHYSLETAYISCGMLIWCSFFTVQSMYIYVWNSNYTVIDMRSIDSIDTDNEWS